MGVPLPYVRPRPAGHRPAAPRRVFGAPRTRTPRPDVMRLTATGCSGWAPGCGGPGRRPGRRGPAASSRWPPAGAGPSTGRGADGPRASRPGRSALVRCGRCPSRRAGGAHGVGCNGRLRCRPAGRVPRSSLVSADDPSLRAAGPAATFARQFHMDPAGAPCPPCARSRATAPATARSTRCSARRCTTPCCGSRAAAPGVGVHARHPDRPVLLVVDGPVHLAALSRSTASSGPGLP